MKFKYEKLGIGKNTVYYPSLDINIINPKTKVISKSYKVLVDSGASITIFHAKLGENIGLDIKSGRQEEFSGATAGLAKVYFHKIIIMVRDVSQKMEVGFSYELSSWIGLLGQKDFFKKNIICFNLSKKEFEINPR